MTTTYTIKAKVNGTYTNLWSGCDKQEARRISDNYNSTIPFGGDRSWIWDEERELVVI
jgi:hypothetical protein